MTFTTRTISGVEVDCAPLPEYPRGADLLFDLTAIASGPLADLARQVAGRIDLSKMASMTTAQMAATAAVALGDDGAGKLIAAIGEALKTIPSAQRQHIIGELLTGCTATVPKEGGGLKRLDLGTPAAIQIAINASKATGAGGYGFLARLVGFSLEVNYGGFFVGAFGGTSAPASAPAGSPTLTP